MAKLNINRELYVKIGKSAVNYYQKLENQSKEIQKQIDSLKDVWNGNNAKQAITALEKSRDLFKQMHIAIEPYNNQYKKITNKLKSIYGDIE